MRILLGIVLCVLTMPAMADRTIDTHDPNRTATIFVHGFDSDGADMSGVFGEDVEEPLLVTVAGMSGLPANDGSQSLQPSVVTATSYYGDTPPSYYTAQDIAELEAVTKQWGGGIPRYALIVAKYARHVMDRSGAQQVNFVSASMGTFVTRWLIENDCDGLVADGNVARWLSLEGVLSGNWAASNGLLSGLWDMFGTPPIDVDQMHYDWVDANVHSPRTETDSPMYGDILVGMEVSTRDTANDGALSDIMLLEGDFKANDGVQAVDNAYFHWMAPQSRFMGKSHSMTWFHVDHYGLADHGPGMAQIVNFITQRRRVVATITRLQVTDIHEPDDWWWDWTPAEIVIESDVYSPRTLELWGIAGSMSERGVEGVSSPIYEFGSSGDQQMMDHVVYDDFLAEGETSLTIDIGGFELDWNDKYGVQEPIGDGDAMGETSIAINVSQAGIFSQEFAASDFNGTLEVRVIDYPFKTLDDVLPGDVDGSGVVDVSDLLAVINAWGPCSSCPEDLDQSGTVDVSDLLIVIANWS